MNVITLQRVPTYTGLNGESIDSYFMARQRVIGFLKNRVLTPFTAGLKAQTGWTKENRPSEQVEQEIVVDQIPFVVKTIPTTLRPSYEKLYCKLTRELDHLKAQYEQEIRRKGVVSFEQRPYINLRELTVCYEKWKGEILDKGVRQGISFPQIESLDSLVVPLVNYSRLEQGSGRCFVSAKRFYADVHEDPVKKLIARVKEETGYDKTNVPSETVESWMQVDKHLVYVQTIPKTSVGYAAILKGLFGPRTKTGKIGKGTGVLTIAQDSKLDCLDIRKYEGERVVSLDDLLRVIDGLTSENSKRQIDKQNLEIYPVM
tara:strand:- start:4305 stop:5252 length:948 start_codon:yes stop_codon:yes gene_type:complete